MNESLALPMPFGRYMLREAIASGGMAEVFRASLPGFGGFEKTVAIKRMYRQYSQDPTFVEMLLDEAKIVSQLNHPNIAQILDFSRVDNDYYLALEYVAGVDLFRLLQRHFERKVNLPVALTVFIIAELCSALDYAHARKTQDGDPLEIIHRDVSPQNILVGFQGEVKLTDFGIAKAAYRYTQTQAGMVKGKLYYMSPEQARGEELDPRSDLFAAGILLFELLCTRPMYAEQDQDKLLQKVRSGSVQWPPERRVEVPTPLLQVADKALSPSPADRYPSGREFRRHLLAAAREVGQIADRERLGAYLRTLYEVSESPALVEAHAAGEQPKKVEHWSNSEPSGQPLAPGSASQPSDPTEAPEASPSVEGPATTTALVSKVNGDEPPKDDATAMLDLHEIAVMLGQEVPETSIVRERPSAEELQQLEEGDDTELGHAQPAIKPPPTSRPISRRVRVPNSVVSDHGEDPEINLHGEPTTTPQEDVPRTLSISDVMSQPPPIEDVTRIHDLNADDSTRFGMSAHVPEPHRRSSSSRVAQPTTRPRAPTPLPRPNVAEVVPETASWRLIFATMAVWAGVVALGMYSLLLVLE